MACSLSPGQQRADSIPENNLPLLPSLQVCGIAGINWIPILARDLTDFRLAETKKFQGCIRAWRLHMTIFW